jgi:thioredoxin-related protein
MQIVMKIWVLLGLVFIISNVFSQELKQENAVQWLTIEQALEKNKSNPKKILIDVYTNWCGWCKVMDKNTFNNPNIAAFINQNFYAVKLNAEANDTITYKGKDYVNKGTGSRPPHEFAIEILKGQMSYPTIVYMDEKSDLITAVPGYMTADQIEPLLLFFAEDIYKQIPYDSFKKHFEKTFKDSVLVPDAVKWLSIEKAFELNTQNPKKILIHFYTDYSILSRVMQYTSFNHPLISSYINENFYPVKFDALRKDTVNVLGQKYFNENKEHPFHQFPVVLMQGKMKFPNLVVVGSDNKLITQIPEYLSPVILETALSFFKEDAFKTITFDKYRQTHQSKITE